MQTETDMAKLAFIGMGVMGAPMAGQDAGLTRYSLGERHQARDRPAGAAQDDLLTSRSPIDQRGELRLGLGDVHGA
jgi:hypothetical protein